MSFWTEQSVLVAGGGGFLGSYVVEKLRRRKCEKIFVPRKNKYDLRKRADVERALHEARPDLVIHLAAVVGGIGANCRYPGRFFYENALMGIELMECSRRSSVQKFVSIGSVCAYPEFTSVPFREDDLWNGWPEQTNAPYGMAKKMLLVMGQAYRREYNFNAIYLLPANLYGPRDSFDLENSHVIPSLIRKFVEARVRRENCVHAWGTGKASREFLYVEDAAEGILLAAEKYDKPEPVNLGCGQEIQVKDLADRIASLTGFHGEIAWDRSKPDGQPRRCLDTSRAKQEFGFVATTSLEEGLRKTVEWYTRTAIPEASGARRA